MYKSGNIKKIADHFEIHKSETNEYYIVLDSQNNIKFLESFIGDNNILQENIKKIDLFSETPSFINYKTISSLDLKKFQYQCLLQDNLYSGHNRVVYDCFDDFVHRLKIQNTKKDIYLVTENDFFTLDQTNPSIRFENYIFFLKLFEILHSYSDHMIDKNSHIQYIFLGKAKLELDTIMTIECFDQELQEKELFLNIFENWNKSDIAIISSLLKTTLYNFLIKSPKEKRFLFFLKNFDLITKEIESTYLIYLQEYTFDKVREELQEKNSEYYKRLNESLSDTLLKSLSLPLSFFLVIGKIKTESILHGIGIIVGLLIIQFIIYNLIKNQRNNVTVIKEEYELLNTRIQEPTGINISSSNIQNKIKSIIDNLNTRTNSIFNVLTWIKRLSVFFTCVIILIVLFLQYENIENTLKEIDILYCILFK